MIEEAQRLFQARCSAGVSGVPEAVLVGVNGSFELTPGFTSCVNPTSSQNLVNMSLDL